MTSTRKLTDDLSVCAFVKPEEIAGLARDFRTIINNRPDCEEPGQASSAELEAAARRAGLDYVHLPVVPGQITDEQVAAFDRALANAPGPVLAFCRTGTRSASLWALSQSGQRETDAILAAAAAAGYDLQALRPRIERANPA